ncbi:hypothetical protein CRE_20146 [Caenorhabditis remanei]|uniref:F-box C protein n=1 Tax=Caenorhabditis remanei TaxID=31234 RepID=E3NTK2_CAERE|nr:hypothetical protein CRE_20146 [Caenorhabditis remanei]
MACETVRRLFATADDIDLIQQTHQNYHSPHFLRLLTFKYRQRYNFRNYDNASPALGNFEKLRGGLQGDIDVYGLPIETQNETGNMPDDNKEVAILQQEIKSWEEKLRNKERTSDYIKFAQLEIKIAQWKIEMLQMRINKSLPPYCNYLQLTVITGHDIKMERVVYEKSFKLTREYIEKRIFSNGNIQVRNLQIGEDGYTDDLVGLIRRDLLQLPIEPLFRFSPQGDIVRPLLSIREGCLEVEVLKVTGNVTNAVTSLQKVLSALPLKQLRTVHQPFPDDPIIKTSQLFMIVKHLPFTVLSTCPNKRTHFEGCPWIFNEQLINVVKKWMESNIIVGTYYSIGDNDAQFVEEMLSMFRNLPGAQSGENKETR